MVFIRYDCYDFRQSCKKHTFLILVKMKKEAVRKYWIDIIKWSNVKQSFHLKNQKYHSQTKLQLKIKEQSNGMIFQKEGTLG